MECEEQCQSSSSSRTWLWTGDDKCHSIVICMAILSQQPSLELDCQGSVKPAGQEGNVWMIVYIWLVRRCSSWSPPPPAMWANPSAILVNFSLAVVINNEHLSHRQQVSLAYHSAIYHRQSLLARGRWKSHSNTTPISRNKTKNKGNKSGPSWQWRVTTAFPITTSAVYLCQRTVAPVV